MIRDAVYNVLFSNNNEIADEPLYFHIEVANRCNLSCQMCSRDKWNISDNNMQLDTFKRILSRIEKAELITLFGLGEPLTNPEIFEMVRLCKQRGFKVAFTTNGYLLNEARAKEVFESGLDYIRFSVDTVAEGAGEGHKYSSVAIGNIERLATMRGDGKVPEVTFNTVVSMDNVKDVEKVILFAKKAGVDGVNLIAIVPQFVQGQVKRMPLIEGIKIYRHLVEFGRHAGVPVRGSGFYDRSWAKKGIALRYRWRYCPRTTNYLYITETGDATPCCWMPRYKMGNVFEESLMVIWSSESLRLFRERWRSICGDCNLMK